MIVAVDPVAAATYFVQQLGCTAFPVWGSRNGRCNCGDPHDGTRKHQPENVGKHPASPNGFKDATSDTAAIARFLSNPGTPNYGLNAPPGILVVDVDGPEGLAKWDDLQHRHGPLPVTLTTLTANGRHYFYRWPMDAGPMPTGTLFGFITRHHDDGYIIGPGSVHPTGVVYDTLRQGNGHPYAIAELPRGWADAAVAPTAVRSGVLTVDAGGYQVPEPGYDGARYDEIVRYTASRYIRGLPKDEIWTGVLHVLAPRFAQPLTEAELRSRFERAWANTPRRLGPPMEPRQGEDGEVRLEAQSDGGDLLSDDVVFPFPEPPDRIAYGGLMGEMVAAILDGTDSSEVGLLASLVGLCGSLVPARAYFGRTQTSTPHIALVGESSIGRKGTAMNRALDALATALGADRLNRVVMDGINSGEGLVTELERRQVGSRGEPTAAVVFEEEFANLLAAAGRDGSSLDSRMRQAFDGGPLSNRKAAGSQTVLPPYWLSALVGITPTELQDKGPAGALTSGSANRWLWLPVVRREEDVANVPPELPVSLRQRLWEAHDAALASPPDLAHGADVSRLLTDYGKHLVKDATGLAKDLSRRYPIIAFRIGMVHAALERSAEVTSGHVWRGIALTEYARQGIPWVFGYTVGNELATLILRHLREVGTLTKRQITQDWARDPVKRQRALDELRRLGFAEVMKVTGTGGRARSELRLVGGRGAFDAFVRSVRSVPEVQSAHVKETHGTHGSDETHGMHGMHGSARNRDSEGRRVCPACKRNHPAGTTCASLKDEETTT